MASCTTRTRRMRADSTASGACTSGSTALRWAATRTVSGGAATMSTPSAEAGVRTLDATGGRVVARHTWTAHASDRFFLGVSALAFVASAAATVLRCASMSSLGRMPMPGGWTMSMAWQRMPGETWSGAAASFLAMWVVMMVAMMLPSLVPTLWRYRRAVGIAGAPRLEWLTPAVTIGYFAICAALGAAVFPLGAATAAIAMRLPALARGVPIARGVVVVVAGALQCTAWTARHLVCWKASPHGAQ